jgi:hypothetical protein
MVRPKSVIGMIPETVVRGELWFMQTYDNLRHNSRVFIRAGKELPSLGPGR